MNFFRNLSIKGSISILVIVSVVICSAIALISYNQMIANMSSNLEDTQGIIQSLSDQSEKTIIGNLEQINVQADQSFSIFLNKMREILKTIESNEKLEILASHNNIPQGNYEGTPFAILPPHNKESINRSLTPYFANIVEGIKEIQFAYIGTPDKAMYIGPLDDFDFTAFDPTSRPWYQDAVQSPDDYIWTDPYIDAITGKPIMSLGKAVSINDELVGVAAMDFSLDNISAMVTGIEIGEAGFAFLLDQNGVLLAHPQWQDQLGQNIKEQFAFLDPVYQADKGELRYEIDGTEMIGYFVTNELTGWKLIVTAPKNEILNIQSAIEGVKQQNELTIAGLNERKNSITALYIGVGLLLAIIGFMVASLYSKSITQRIEHINEAMGQLSKGDLTQKVQVNDDNHNEIEQLGKHFNHMSNELLQMVRSNVEISKRVDEASSMLVQVSDKASIESERMGQSINVILTLIEQQSQRMLEMASVVDGFTESIEVVSQVTQHVDQSIDQSNVVNKEAAASIEMLEETSEKGLQTSKLLSGNIQALDEQMKRVEQFTSAIKGISEQTNLLALNAAIEAARVGEHGKGFAVVAGEIRKLSVQASQSAEEIEEAIIATSDKVQRAVADIRETEQLASQQYEVFHSSKLAFKSIEQSTMDISQHMQQVSQIVREIGDKNDQLKATMMSNTALSEQAATHAETMRQILDSQAEVMREVATSTDRLADVSETLHREIPKFKIK